MAAHLVSMRIANHHDPTPVVRLPDREQLAQGGVDARYKMGGPGDLYIVPLGNALAEAREHLLVMNSKRR
jgi:hypothetical protein